MKRNVLVLFVLTLAFTSTCVFGQLINPGFETWTADALAPTAMNPNTGNNSTGWWTYNMFNYSVLGSSPISVFRCDTAHSGTYSARIKTVIYTTTSHNYNAPWGVPFIGHDYSDTLGILFNGTTNETAATFKPGIPFTQKISSLSFWYRYAPQSGDTAECRALLVTNRTPQGGGLVKITNATGANWQQATINFSYVDNQTPDTLYILFSSSSLDSKPKPGSMFWVDDVSVVLSTGIDQAQGADNSLNIFPNPSNGIFHIQSPLLNKSPRSITIYNVLGEQVYSISGNNKAEYNIDLSQLPKGIYFVKLDDGQKVYMKKIVVQ